ARLLRLGNFAHEIDIQQAVLKARAGYDHMLSELEATLEGPRRDALMQELAAVSFACALLRAADRQGVLAGFDREVVLGEARDGQRHAIGVLAGALDVIGRIVRRRLEPAALGEVVEQPVETDGLAEQGRKVESTHCTSSC